MHMSVLCRDVFLGVLKNDVIYNNFDCQKLIEVKRLSASFEMHVNVLFLAYTYHSAWVSWNVIVGRNTKVSLMIRDESLVIITNFHYTRFRCDMVGNSSYKL